MTGRLTTQFSIELGFSFDTSLARNLEILKNATIHQDFDGCILVDGKEGSGKSVLAMQIGKFMDIDQELDIEKQICFTPEQVVNAINTLPKFKAIVWDEARRGLNRRRSTGQINLEITDLFAECRQKNLFLIVTMPSFYDMDMNVAVWRSRALIHVYYKFKPDDNRPLERGYFIFYNEEGKKKLYTTIENRRGYNYFFNPRFAFRGRFTHQYVVDEHKYRDKKRVSMADYQHRNDKKVTETIPNNDLFDGAYV